jgi:prepilin-type N-terminal cleavage/methylation domain-containing protein
MDANARRRTPRSHRRGFSLIELLVAIVIIDVGVLALAATTLALVAQRTELRARAVAVRAASTRLEWLGAGPCQATSGSAAAGALVVEHWDVQPGANATRELSDSVTFGHGNAHTFVVRTRLPC